MLDVFYLTNTTAASFSKDKFETGSTPLIAGKVSLNTRQGPVLKALLQGALLDEIAKNKLLSKSDAETVTQTLMSRTMGNQVWAGPLTNVSDLVGRLLGKSMLDQKKITEKDPVYASVIPKAPVFNSNGVTILPRNNDFKLEPMSQNGDWLEWDYTGFSADLDQVFEDTQNAKNKRKREAVIRALADAGQTRVWNLLIDVILQTGRLPSGANDLTRFTKSSEVRVWVHLSIDRLTGEILERQLEWVPE